MTPTPLKKGDTAKIAGMSAPIITKSWVIAKQWWAVKRDGVVIAFVGANQPKKQGKEIADGLISAERKRAKGKSA